MKKLLYIFTMLFNAMGSICTMSLFLTASQFCYQNLFLILAGSMVFVMSFTITVIDYKHVFGRNNFVVRTIRR